MNCKNNQNNTPLHTAYAFGTYDEAKYLKALGADEHAKNTNGNWPHESLSWLGVRKIVFPFYKDDESYPECGGLYIPKLA